MQVETARRNGTPNSRQLYFNWNENKEKLDIIVLCINFFLNGKLMNFNEYAGRKRARTHLFFISSLDMRVNK